MAMAMDGDGEGDAEDQDTKSWNIPSRTPMTTTTTM